MTMLPHLVPARRRGALASLLLLAPLGAQITIAPATNLPVGTQPDEAAVGDLDGDGDLDFVVAISGPVNGVGVWRNDGAGAFTLAANVNVASQARAVGLGDFDRDGDLDLAVGAGSPNAVFVLRNNGAGVFANATSFPIGPNARGLTVADLDRDFDLDLAIANRDGDSVSVLRNNGAGVFTVTTLAVGDEPRNVIAADFNADGLPDLATSNHDSRDVSVLRNLGNGAFAAHVTYPVNPSVRPEWVTAADTDADGDLDLVAAIGETLGQVAVFANAGNGTLAPATYFSTGGAEPGVVLAADLDGDRAVDLIVANEDSDNVTFLRNSGSGSFVVAATVPAGQTPEGLAAGDFDGDGDVDVLAVNRDTNDVSVLRNTTAAAATAPVIRFAGSSAPGGVLRLELTSPTDRASDYLLLLSIATTPPIVLPDNRVVPLADTALLLLPGLGGAFADGLGVLDGSGSAFARLNVPAGLSGVTLVFGFVELDPRMPFFIGSISDAASIVLQ